MIRNIDGLGISKLYIIQNNPIRGKKREKWLHTSSVGADRHVYVREFTTTSQCLRHLRQRGYVSLVTSPHSKSHHNIPLRDGNYGEYPKLAIWFGNESSGISEEAIEGSEGCINIDMCGIVESLNLSISTAIVLHHVASERRTEENQKKIREHVRRKKGRCA